MHWIDILVIAVVGIFVLIGLWKGFFNGLFSLCSIFVSFLIAINTANWFAGILRKIVNIDSWFDHFLQDTCGVGDSLVIFGGSYPREKVAAFLTVLLAGILMFIFLRCLILLLKNLFSFLTKASLTIGLFNRIFGAILGAVKAGVLVVIVLMVCSVITSLGIPSLSNGIANNIAQTKITSFVYGYVDKFVEAKMTGKSFEEYIEGVFDEETANAQDQDTYIEVVYAYGSNNYYTFTLGEEVDYSKIIVIYKAGDDISTVKYSPIISNFSEPIDTSKLTDKKEITVTMFGKTDTFRYRVIEA